MTLSKTEIGKLIKEARYLKSQKTGTKYTQSMLANDLSKSQSYIGDLESGRTYPNYTILYKISKACGVPFSFFGDLDEEIRNYLSIKYPDTTISDDADILNHYKRFIDTNYDCNWLIDNYYRDKKYGNCTKAFNEWLDTTSSGVPKIAEESKITIPITKNLTSDIYFINPSITLGEITLNYNIDRKCSHIAFLVPDDSMNLNKIAKNDIVIIQREPEIQNGELAGVIINNSESLIRRVYISDSIITLIPNSTNTTYEPLTLNISNVQIIGKVTKVLVNL